MPDQDAPTRRLLAAAERHFFEFGVAAVSIDTLCRDAKVSKTTFYRRFASKSALLATLVAEASDQLVPPSAQSLHSFESFRKTLITFGTNLLKLLDEPEKQQFERLVIAEAGRAPEVAEVFYQAAYARTLSRLQSLIQAGIEAGLAEANLPPQELAEWLLELWKGHRHTRVQLALEAPLSAAARKQRVSHLVDCLIWAKV